jgi:hypothetical protein
MMMLALDDNVEFVDVLGDLPGVVGNVHDMGVLDDVKESVHKSSLVVDVLGVLQEEVEDPFSIVVVLRSMFDVLAFNELLVLVDAHVQSVGVFAPSDGLDNMSSSDDNFVSNLDEVSDVLHYRANILNVIDCSNSVRFEDASNDMKEYSSVFFVTLGDFHEVLPHGTSIIVVLGSVADVAFNLLSILGAEVPCVPVSAPLHFLDDMSELVLDNNFFVSNLSRSPSQKSYAIHHPPHQDFSQKSCCQAQVQTCRQENEVGQTLVHMELLHQEWKAS